MVQVIKITEKQLLTNGESAFLILKAGLINITSEMIGTEYDAWRKGL